MNKLILGILLITIFAIVSITCLSYYIACQPNKASNTPTPTPKPTSSPSEIPSISEQSVPEFTLKFVDNTVQAKIKNNIGASYYNFRYKTQYADKWSYYPHNPDRGAYGILATYDPSPFYALRFRLYSHNLDFFDRTYS